MGVGRHGAVAMAGALCLCAMAQAADDGHAIALRRPARPGDVYAVHLIFEQTYTERSTALAAPAPLPPGAATMLATMPGAAALPELAAATAPDAPPPSAHSIHADLTCRVEVVDVNFRGEKSLAITVDKFVALPDGAEMVPAGKVISLQADSADVSLALRGGGVLSEDARAVLQQVHPLEYQLDDQGYGAPAPRKAGESWDVDAASVAQVDSNVRLKVDPASVRGRVTLAGLEKSGDVPALRIKAELAHEGADRFRKSTGEMFDHVAFKAEISELLPVDEALPALESQIVSDVHATGTRLVEDHGAVREWGVAVDTHTSQKQTITRLAK